MSMCYHCLTLLYLHKTIGLFILWAYLPDATLQTYGLTYYPSKQWAVGVPAMIVVTYLFSIVLYKALNLLSTPSLQSYATIFGT